jgi:NTP pyrophosphatase (non-canonical NTP hydrolase)
MQETQVGIAQWCEDTFGVVTTDFRLVLRAIEEMVELLNAVDTKDYAKVSEEAADVVIVLSRLAVKFGVTLKFTCTSGLSSPGADDLSWLATRANMALAEVLCGVEISPYSLLPEKLEELMRRLVRTCEAVQGELEKAIDTKMAVNRARKWRLLGDGTGYHIKEERSESLSK